MVPHVSVVGGEGAADVLVESAVQSRRESQALSNPAEGPAYESFYQGFDSPLMRRVRGQAYGEDIGQHSWTSADELRLDIGRLGLAPGSRLLDLGCGPGGPLTFVLRSTGCRGLGLERSAAAARLARDRAAALGVEGQAAIREADLDRPLPLESGSFEAAMALDVVLHLRDRAELFREVARVLVPGGRFLLTDAGVLTGEITNEEAALRGLHAPARFVRPGFNEEALERAGFLLLETQDRTEALAAVAAGRLEARTAHRQELETAEGLASVVRQEQYLQAVIDLARRRSLSRFMYLAQSHGR